MGDPMEKEEFKANSQNNEDQNLNENQNVLIQDENANSIQSYYTNTQEFN